MQEEKLNDIVDALVGIKAYEWAKVRKAVQDIFDQKYSRLEISDREKLRTNLKIEIGALDTD